MPPVKRDVSAALSTLRGRLQLLRLLFAPGRKIPLSYPQFADAIGLEYSAVKAWAKQGREVSKGGEDAILATAGRLGVGGVTVDWLRRGVGDRPQKGDRTPPGKPPERSGAGKATSTGSQFSDAAQAKGASDGAAIAGTDGPLSRMLEVIGKAVGAAVRRTIEKDLIENTGKARQSLADSLFNFALELQRGGVDATELFEVVQQIRDGRLLR